MIRTALAGCALALLAAGCVMPGQMDQIQKDLADVRQELREVQNEQSAASGRLAALEQAAEGRDDRAERVEIADMKQRLDQVQREVEVSNQRLNELGGRVERLARTPSTERPAPGRDGASSMLPPAGPYGQPAEPPASPSGATPPAATARPDAKALYSAAYGDFSKGNFALAISGFEEYVEQFPDSSDADNALYWIGECHFSQGNFSEAVQAFDRLLDRYPGSDKAAAANLKKALAYLEQNQIGQAIVQFRYVDSTFPGSDEAKIARDKLTSLGAPI